MPKTLDVQELVTRKLASLGSIVVAAVGSTKNAFDFICLANPHTRDPLNPDQLCGAGWIGVSLGERGFSPEELRAIAWDRGGRVIFVVLDGDEIRFEARTKET